MEPEMDTSATPLAWEDPAFEGGRLAKGVATARTLLGDPGQAGQALGIPAKMGFAIGFYALFGLPCQWLAAALVHVANMERPDRMAWVFEWFHLPAPPTPTAQQLAFQKIMGWGQVVAYPLIAALGILIMGGLAHLGLWMVRGLTKGKGIEVTYRTGLFLAGALSWVWLINVAGAFLPGGLFWAHQAFSLALGLGILTYQGMVLAEAHGVERWRGILGVFLPGILLCLVCLCCVALVGLGAAGLAQGRT